MPSVYDVGDLVRVGVLFKNAAGTLTDPAAVRYRVEDPAGVKTTYVYPTDAELVKAGTGDYYVHQSAALPGVYSYRFWSTGSGQAAVQGQFRVQPSGLD